jgi:hypothetical protein
MPKRYRAYIDEDTAALQSVALWQALCVSRGVTPAGIAAGVETLDSTPDGTPVLPPLTVGVPTVRGIGAAAVIVPRTGVGALLQHRAWHETFDGSVWRVAGRDVSITSAVGATADALPENLRTDLEEREAFRLHPTDR